MIRLSNRFMQFAYSVPFKVSAELKTAGFEEGTFVVPSGTTGGVDNGITLPGETGKGAKAYMVLSSKRTGRDNISAKPVDVAQVSIGPAIVDTDQIEADVLTKAPGTPLYVTATGTLTATDPTSGTGVIVAYLLDADPAASTSDPVEDYRGFSGAGGFARVHIIG